MNILNHITTSLALLAWAITSYTTADQSYVEGLDTPFSALTSGTTLKAPNYFGQDELGATEYKQTILHNILDTELARIQDHVTGFGTPVSRIVVEVGSGSGFQTFRLARHIYEQKQVNGLGYVSEMGLLAVDDFRARLQETSVRGYITIPDRSSFGAAAESGGHTAEEAVQQFLSNLAHAEAASGLGVKTILADSNLQIARLTSDSIYGGARSDEDFVAAPQGNDFLTIVPSGDSNPLATLLPTNGSLFGNTRGKAGVIIIDTDPITGQQMFNTLKCAWNALDINGVLIIDDLGWFPAHSPGTSPVLDGFNAFVTQFAANIQQFNGSADYTDDSYITKYIYNGSDPTPETTVVGGNNVFDDVLESYLDIHNIWPGRGRWMAVLRRGIGNSSDVDLETLYGG